MVLRQRKRAKQIIITLLLYNLSCLHWPIYTYTKTQGEADTRWAVARTNFKLLLSLQSRTIVKRGSFGKVDEIGPILWGQSHTAIGHSFDVWKDVTRLMFFLTDSSERGHQGCQGLWDVTVVHIRLIDLKLLSCGEKQIRFKAYAANGTLESPYSSRTVNE